MKKCFVISPIGSTTNRCDLMSLTLDSWKNRSGFHELIVRKSREGCRIRLLQMHEDNPMLRDFAAEPKSFEYLAPLAKLTSEYFQSISNDLSNVEFRQVRHGCPHFRIVLTDDQAFMSPYSYSSTSSPVFESSKNCNLYESVRVEFEGLWRKNGG